MMIGSGCPVRFSNTSKPSSSGICTSRKTRSGCSARIWQTASRPFPHSFTSSMSGTPLSKARRLRRAGGSSSTIIALIFLLFALLIVVKSGGQAQRYGEQNFSAALFAVADFKHEIRSIKLPQPRFGVQQTHAFTAGHPPALGQSDPVIADAQL